MKILDRQLSSKYFKTFIEICNATYWAIIHFIPENKVEGPTIIILRVSSSEELMERGLKYVLKLFFAKFSFKFIFNRF